MRTHHAIAIGLLCVVTVGFGARLVFFSARTADADAPTLAIMNIGQMQRDYQNMKDLPVQTIRDMGLVFSDGD